mmetsp:Transcript_18197/g.39797  ORF Transcript_18197/g.39797 Transcript_18197/m.39797 type:complete len:171 (-) Transcript_18197:336-848(-)|eukprot:CAMPEP_0118935260 /NCGR_PEP_ID=MMETSP1169-20130426/15284_1 /TAXON_ID=36882 /ORGANISM="Pyramimonas obovata, Strain CCMP722" /LENGTH=170 /DNA_ID=CAMNT_0006878269 /DNA_START=65 /DNA_END=577 /DNA_ORIENTATION=+
MAQVGKYKDLFEHIDIAKCYCLNEKSNHSWENAVKQGPRDMDTLFCESDTDEQLLMSIPFQQVVKLYAIKIKAIDSNHAPKVLKLFVNRESLGFSEASSEPAVQTLDLDFDKHCSGEPIELKFVKFQSVRSIQIFIESNQDDEETTQLSHISFIGATVETTNMSEFKAVG